MKQTIFAASLGTASAGLLRVNRNTTLATDPDGTASYGSLACPCVGFDNVGGTTDVTLDGTTVKYPADLGARCEDWDLDTAPACKGNNPEPWCAQNWCYVDPCNCDLPQVPKISNYQPDTLYQGKPVYYSYETCNAKDAYTSKHHKDACANQYKPRNCEENPKCLWHNNRCGGKEAMGQCKQPLEAKWGEDECKCVGIHGQEGTIKVRVGDPEVTMEYPADTGATCQAWDLDRHPECTGANKPSWCSNSWCYVDPCSCKHATPPTGSNYMPDSTFQGKQIFYSYATCGTTNEYSASHQKRALKKQAEVCSSAWSFSPVVALLLPFLCFHEL